MATHTTYVNQTISTKLLMSFFIAMIMAFAFVAILTNMIINSKVNAAYQSNPVTVAAPTQTNNPPVASVSACALPAGSQAASPDTVTGGGTESAFALPWSAGYAVAGNYSQSNSSVMNTTSTNTFIKDSYNSTSSKMVDNRWSGNSLSANNGNTYTDNRNSGNSTNTTTNTTVNTDNSNHSVNTNIQDSGNTTNTTLNTLIDNSQQNNTAVAVGGLGIATVVD